MRRFAVLFVAVLLALLVAPHAAGAVSYPGDGWFPPHATFEWQHPDQGRDIVTGWQGIVQAPGSGCVVAILSDRPFPNGFGPDYPLVRIDTGPFASPLPWYLGHTSALVSSGQCFKFGQPLSRADQGRPSWIGYHEPVDGGWVEIGQEQPDGTLGPFSSTGHWFDALLQQTLQVGDPLDFLSKVKFKLPNGHTASEYNTVSTFEGHGCWNPVIRPVCKSSRLNEQYLRDRDIWVTRHRLTARGWVPLARPNYRNGLGPRIHRLQYDLHRQLS